MERTVYFICVVKTATVDGIEYKDAKIVDSVFTSTTPIPNAKVVPPEYIGCDIVGCMYVERTNKFVQVDHDEPIQEPTWQDQFEAEQVYQTMLLEMLMKGGD